MIILEQPLQLVWCGKEWKRRHNFSQTLTSRDVNKLPRSSESPVFPIHSLMFIISSRQLHIDVQTWCLFNCSLTWPVRFDARGFPLSFSGYRHLLSCVLRGAGDGGRKCIAPPLFLHFDLSDPWVVPDLWSVHYTCSKHFIFFFLGYLLILSFRDSELQC